MHRPPSLSQMLLRKTCLLLLLSALSTFAQSIDEEERVHVGEGSGNAITDDEDSVEGSSLPPDHYYATTPQVRPKFSQSTRMETTTKKIITTTSERIVTSPRMTIESSTTDSRPAIPFGTSMFFGSQGIFIILGIIMVLLIILIMVVLCFKARNNKKQAYRPGQRESPDALLKE